MVMTLILVELFTKLCVYLFFSTLEINLIILTLHAAIFRTILHFLDDIEVAKFMHKNFHLVHVF